MADHVSEMATQIVMPQSAVNTAFRSESNANEFPTPLLVIVPYFLSLFVTFFGL